MPLAQCSRRGYCRKHCIFAVADGGFAYAHSVFPFNFVGVWSICARLFISYNPRLR